MSGLERIAGIIFALVMLVGIPLAYISLFGAFDRYRPPWVVARKAMEALQRSSGSRGRREVRSDG
jgi:hypothetical protein